MELNDEDDDDDDEEAEAVEDFSKIKSDEDVEFPCLSSQSLLVNQSRLNDLVRDFNLSKNQAEMLSSRLKEVQKYVHSVNGNMNFSMFSPNMTT